MSIDDGRREELVATLYGIAEVVVFEEHCRIRLELSEHVVKHQ